MATFVTVDLDDIDCYHHIHGLPAPVRRGMALRLWLPRFIELFERQKTRATFFVIGKDLEHDLRGREGRSVVGHDGGEAGEGARELKRALAAGHELGNHSYAHAYDMVSWDAPRIAQDLARCDTLLRGLGAKPEGFRAPGYTHNRKLLSQVAALGYRYDSSRLPSPGYYLAKRSVMAVMSMRGKVSASYKGGAGSFFGEKAPHYLSELGLWEVPMSVSRVLRMPLIGTFLFGAPKAVRKQLMREAMRRRDLVLEMHAIDLADPEADGIDPVIVAQHAELRVPLERRIEAFEALLKARKGGESIARGLPFSY